MRQLRSLHILFVLVSTALLSAIETPIPPSPTRWVTDTANFLSPDAVRSLEARLAAYEKNTGHQLIVYITATTGDAPIEDWAVRAFKNWQVGRKGLDDGLALFIMSKDQKLRIEVGYGLEGVVPDAIASRVINEVIAPRIQGGDPDGAVTAGIDALTGAIGGHADAVLPPARTQEKAKPLSSLQWVLYGIGGILLLVLFITNPSLAFFFLISMMSGRNRMGQGGGGGFGGGGGRSGGGGASGSW